MKPCVKTRMLSKVYQSTEDYEFVQNPYPFYEKIRQKSELVYWEDYHLPCTGSYSLVNSLLRDKRFGRRPPKGFFSNIPDGTRPFFEIEECSMLEQDPPYHTKLRASVLHYFTKNKIKAIETEIEALANQLLDQISSGRTDILENYARKIPVIVIARMLGVPESMCDQLLIWSNNMVGMYQANRTKDIEAKAVESALDFSKYLKTLILEKRKFPSKDIISNLLINSEFQESLSDKEIITTSILLLNAGHEATTHTIGNSIKTILELEIPFSHLKNQPVLAIEELLRFDPPLHLFTRYALNDCLIQDYKFTEGSKVGLLLAAANRDPKVFTKASKFCFNRHERPHLSFGAGIHFCLGALLAKAEMAVAIRVLIERHPKIKLSGKPEFSNKYHFHGLKSLYVEI